MPLTPLCYIQGQLALWSNLTQILVVRVRIGSGSVTEAVQLAAIAGGSSFVDLLVCLWTCTLTDIVVLKQKKHEM